MLIPAFGFNLSIYSWHVHGIGTVKQYAAGNRNKKDFEGLLCDLYALIRVMSGLRKSITAILARAAQIFSRSREIYLPVLPLKSMALLR
jgi:hypothetical protein